jgi:hypothetical protein
MSITSEPILGGNDPDKLKEVDNNLVFSYLTLRNLIGCFGMALPLVLAIHPKRVSAFYGFEPSISDYFYTDRGDILVVFLSIISVFLLTYKGYTTGERILTILAAIAGMGVAFVPTGMACGECYASVHTKSGGLIGSLAGLGLHFISAATFLLSLAVMSLVYFPKTNDKGSLVPVDGRMSQKAKRNVVYKITGWIMVLSVMLLGVYFLLKPQLGEFPVVYLLESIAVEAFGMSWLTKGETLWPDGRHFFIKSLKWLKG